MDRKEIIKKMRYLHRECGQLIDQIHLGEYRCRETFQAQAIDSARTHLKRAIEEALLKDYWEEGDD